MKPRRASVPSLLLVLGWTWLAPALAPAIAQEAAPAMSPEERLRMLTDPEAIKKKEKEKARPPIEFFRSQVAPFDILPYVKANHWSTVSLEARANYDDYFGLIRTEPVPLLGMPREMLFRRDARMVKGQRSRISLQLMLPMIPKEMPLELLRPDAIRADEVWQAALRRLEPHQMLVLILTKESNDPYAQWNRLQAMQPTGIDRGDPIVAEARRYYRLVLPLEPGKPPLSPHPLTWTTISHVVWDAMPPDNLNPAQQQAMLDWLHWGGQLILVGGASPSFSILRDSFLAPYLPADSGGESVPLDQAALMPMAQAYPPPKLPRDDDPQTLPVPASAQEIFELTRKYRPPEPIRPASNRPVFLAGLEPRPGASRIPLGESSDKTLGVEWRVGRGRVTMLAINPTDPAFVSWPGLDTFVRRVILRRPEDGGLSGPDLSWYRLLGRDLGATESRPEPYAAPRRRVSPDEVVTPGPMAPTLPVQGPSNRPTGAPVAEWLDSSALPRLTRDIFEEASGITIPSSSFVLKVILAYVLALVPLNWLVCRFVFGRREWAWLVVPILALGFAVGVERAAAYDMGYDIASDEIDLIETFADYPRGYVSRFASLYSTGRVRFSISYPDDPTALALPLDTGRALAGEDVATSAFQSYPTPALEGFEIEPRSLSMFRAEQMISLPGANAMETEDGPPRVVNGTDWELRDAVAIDVGDGSEPRETYLGTIGPGASVELKPAGRSKEPTPKEAIDPEPFLGALRAYVEAKPENMGEIRLVAWSRGLIGGQKLDPSPDRRRGFTAVVVHLRQGPPPAPDGPRYNLLANGPERPPAEADSGPDETVPIPESAPTPPGLMGSGPPRRPRRMPLPK